MKERFAFLVPAVLLMVLAIGLPVLRVLDMSFTRVDLSGDVHVLFAGAANHVRLWSDDRWWNSLKTTALFSAIAIAFETLLGTAFALLLHERFGGRGLARTVMMIPWALPTAVMALAWAWIFNDAFGVWNDLLMRIGAMSQPRAWLGETSTALLALVVADVWKTTPFVALVILAGLQGIPQDIRDAARLDGLGSVQIFRRIVLPLLAPSIVTAIIFRAIQSFAAFDLPYVMTGGGPAGATETISLYAYNTYFRYLDFGYASAMALQGALMVLLLAGLTLHLSRGARVVKRLAFVMALVFLLGWSLAPAAWQVITSIKPDAQITASPTIYWPSPLTFTHYQSLFARKPFGAYLMNSFLVSGGAMILCVALALPAAAGLVTLKARRRDQCLLALLVLTVFPPIMLLFPLYEGVRSLGLMNHRLALILPYAALHLPLAIWVIESDLRGLPREIAEAATLDGLGPWRRLAKVQLPLVMPSVTTAGVLAFMFSWNEFMLALTFATREDVKTVTAGIASVSGASIYEIPWGPLTAAIVIATMPLTFLMFAFEGRIANGLTRGAIKG